MSYRPVSEELKANIAEDLAVGCTFSDIAERYGVSFSTIRRIKNAIHTAAPLNEQKKSPEAPTPMDNASEETNADIIDNTIIPDVPEVVKQEEIPGVVVDALLEKIQNISEKIETEEKYLAALKADKKSLERWYHENCTAFGRDYKRRNNHANG